MKSLRINYRLPDIDPVKAAMSRLSSAHLAVEMANQKNGKIRGSNKRHVFKTLIPRVYEELRAAEKEIEKRGWDEVDEKILEEFEKYKKLYPRHVK